MKRVVAVLVSIVWISLVVGLPALFFVPGLREILPAQIWEYTEMPTALLERWDPPIDLVPTDIVALLPEITENTATPMPEQAMPVPQTNTPVPPVLPTHTPTPVPTEQPVQAMAVADQPRSIAVEVLNRADLYAGPSEDSDILGMRTAGTTVRVNGQYPNGRWYRVEDGGLWIRAEDLADAPAVTVIVPELQQPSGEVVVQPLSPLATPEIQLQPTEVPPVAVKAVVNADFNLRSAPDSGSERVGGVYFDADPEQGSERVDDGVYFYSEVMLVGRSADGEWYQLENGMWLAAAALDNPVDVPLVDTSGLRPPVVNEFANLRAGPGLQFERVGGVVPNQVLTVVAQEGEWLKLEDGSWIFAAYVDNAPLFVEAGETDTDEASSADVDSTDVDSTQAPGTPVDEPTTRATVNTDRAPLRTAPNLDANIGVVVSTYIKGTELTVVGKYGDGEWLKLSNDLWILAKNVDNVPDVPIVDG